MKVRFRCKMEQYIYLVTSITLLFFRFFSCQHQMNRMLLKTLSIFSPLLVIGIRYAQFYLICILTFVMLLIPVC